MTDYPPIPLGTRRPPVVGTLCPYCLWTVYPGCEREHTTCKTNTTTPRKGNP